MHFSPLRHRSYHSKCAGAERPARLSLKSGPNARNAELTVMLNLVLFHSGDSLPSFFWETIIHTRRYWSGPIHLLIPSSYCRDPHVQKYNCISIPVEEISSDALNEFDSCQILKQYGRNNFWHAATQRLFALEAYIRTQGLDHVVHLENDVLIYRDLAEMEPVFLRLYKDTMAVTPMGPRHCTAAFSFIDSADALSKTTERMLSLLKYSEKDFKKLFDVDMVNDMVMLKIIQTEQPEHVKSLPILPKGDQARFIERFGSLFDCASWGQYAGGSPHGHKPGIAFDHHWIGRELLAKRYDLIWIPESNGLYCPYVQARKGSAGIWKLNNLHIHSKRIKDFTGEHIPPSREWFLFNKAARSLKRFAHSSRQDETQRPFCNTTQFLPEYIHGDRFISLADYVIDGPASTMPDQLHEEDGVIFCKTDYLERLFESVRTSNHKYILITHNSDRNIDSFLYDKKPPCIVRWFAQNVLVKKSDLIPIPIGLERPGIGRFGDVTVLSEAACARYKKQGLVYMNHNDHTNPSVRVPLSQKFKGDSYVTRGTNIPYRKYLKEICRHTYLVSPPGNGDDCHRTWEALYAGVFPIVESNPGMAAFAELPMLLVEDYGDLTERFLNENIERLRKQQNMRMLTFSYWREQIEIARALFQE